MNWFQQDSSKENDRPEVASEEERREVFVEWYAHLYWTAFFITGSSDSARQAIANAVASSEQATSVFRDWLVRWARNVTAQEAAQQIHEEIRSSSGEYAACACVHGWHEPLSIEEIDSLRQMPLELVCARIDPLARSVLIMHGMNQNSTATCARTLAIPRNRILSAYCHAIGWLKETLHPATMGTTP